VDTELGAASKSSGLAEIRVLTLKMTFTQDDTVSTIEYVGLQGRDTVIAYLIRDNYVNYYGCTIGGAGNKFVSKAKEIAEDMQMPIGDSCFEASW
jgi:hypothetical protein